MTAMDPIVTALERMEGRLVERIDEASRTLRRDLQLDMDGRFDAVHKRLDRLEQEYEMLKAGMARLEADVATLKTDVATLKTDVAQLKTTVERIEARMDRDGADRKDLREQAVELHRRLGDLEGRVQAMEDRFPSE